METILDLKILVCQLFDAKASYAEAKELAEGRSKRVTELESQVMQALEKSELDSFEVPKVGKITMKETESYQTPKSIDEKKAFFKFIQEKYGDEGFWTYMSINSRSLQTLAKQMVDEGADVIPGLNLPTTYNKLSVRKARN